jgi:hypothetical protein
MSGRSRPCGAGSPKRRAARRRALKEYLDLLPQHLSRRFVSAEQNAVVVTGRIPDIDASQLLPVVERLDQALGDVRAEHPGYTDLGHRPRGDRGAQQRRHDRQAEPGADPRIHPGRGLHRLAFRSFVVMLVSILPGIFPVVISGAVLWLMGEGLQFASVGGADRVRSAWAQRHDPLPEPSALEDRPGEDPRSGSSGPPSWSARPSS